MRAFGTPVSEHIYRADAAGLRRSSMTVVALSSPFLLPQSPAVGGIRAGAESASSAVRRFEAGEGGLPEDTSKVRSATRRCRPARLLHRRTWSAQGWSPLIGETPGIAKHWT